jgi:hypothetical protein
LWTDEEMNEPGLDRLTTELKGTTPDKISAFFCNASGRKKHALLAAHGILVSADVCKFPDGEMDKKSWITRDHAVDYPFLALLVANIILPGR